MFLLLSLFCSLAVKGESAAEDLGEGKDPCIPPFCKPHHHHPTVTIKEIRTYTDINNVAISFCREQTFTNCVKYKQKLNKNHYVYTGGCQDFTTIGDPKFGFECPKLETTYTADCGRGNTEQVTRKTYAHHSANCAHIPSNIFAEEAVADSCASFRDNWGSSVCNANTDCSHETLLRNCGKTCCERPPTTLVEGLKNTNPSWYNPGKYVKCYEDMCYGAGNSFTACKNAGCRRRDQSAEEEMEVGDSAWEELQYEAITSGTCEEAGMETIEHANACMVAVSQLAPGSFSKTTTSTSMYNGCFQSHKSGKSYFVTDKMSRNYLPSDPKSPFRYSSATKQRKRAVSGSTTYFCIKGKVETVSCDGLDCAACLAVPDYGCGFADGACYNAGMEPMGATSFAFTTDDCPKETAVGAQSACFGLPCHACVGNYRCTFADQTCFDTQFVPTMRGTSYVLSMSDCPNTESFHMIRAPSRYRGDAQEEDTAATVAMVDSSSVTLDSVAVYGFATLGCGALLYGAANFFFSKTTPANTMHEEV